jgi:hypothetical protein
VNTVARPSLSLIQTVVAISAGVTSVLGGAYTLWSHVKPEPGNGQVVAIIRELHSEKPVNAATLEILTPKDELVATMTSPESGQLQYTLKEGSYRLRVSHPMYAAEYLAVYVGAGRAAEVRIELSRSIVGSTPVDHAARTVGEGVKRFFKDLGF